MASVLVFTMFSIPGVWDAEGKPFSSLPKGEDTILFVGDFMYDRSVRAYADEKGDDYIFSCMKEELVSYDMVVANLEGPITEGSSVSVGSVVGDSNNTRFTMPLRTAGILAENNIRAVSLANNHANDFGAEGIVATRAALTESGVQFAGDPRDSSTTAVRLGDLHSPVVLVTFNEFSPFGWRQSYEEILEAIRAQSLKDTVIVFAHWGDEYVPATDRQKEWAREFIDSGADMVIGAHPHVVQESEIYRGVSIYYSLGNFIFDQYWDDEVTEGLGLAVTVSKSGIERIKEVPNYRTRDRRTCFSPVE